MCAWGGEAVSFPPSPPAKNKGLARPGLPLHTPPLECPPEFPRANFPSLAPRKGTLGPPSCPQPPDSKRLFRALCGCSLHPCGTSPPPLSQRRIPGPLLSTPGTPVLMHTQTGPGLPGWPRPPVGVRCSLASPSRGPQGGPATSWHAGAVGMQCGWKEAGQAVTGVPRGPTCAPRLPVPGSAGGGWERTGCLEWLGARLWGPQTGPGLIKAAQLAGISFPYLEDWGARLWGTLEWGRFPQGCPASQRGTPDRTRSPQCCPASRAFPSRALRTGAHNCGGPQTGPGPPPRFAVPQLPTLPFRLGRASTDNS